jgi:integrase/recombinase XerC
MNLIDKYLVYVTVARRYSSKTVDVYRNVLQSFYSFALPDKDLSDENLLSCLNQSEIRQYIASRMKNSEFGARSANQHLSVLSGFCRFLVQEGALKSNPARLVRRPKVEQRLPVFYKGEAMKKYFEDTDCFASEDSLKALMSEPSSHSAKDLFKKRLARLIVSMLYALGLRRSELVSLSLSDVDFGRNVVRVRGKGNKMREIPMVSSLCEEILLYLKAVDAMVGRERSLTEPLLITDSGKGLYPVYVDRAVKSELSGREGITGQKSPHILRHSLATGLLDNGADLNSIKELLGHSSLAATQVYTHNSIAKLKDIYKSAHPRAKSGGKNGH